MKCNGFTNLLVWQKAMDLVELIYTVSNMFPESEKINLTNQVRRAAVSIVANIAEGKGRYSDKEFIHFLYIARGSLEESRCLLILASRLGYMSQEEFKRLSKGADEVGLILNAFIYSIKNNKN